MNNIVVTGGLGFIGSHFVEAYRKKFPKSKITVIDKYGVGADLEHIAHVNKVTTWNHDLVNGMPRGLPKHIDAIFHFAAESHVDRSIDSPVPFIKNNVVAMLSVLEYARDFPHTKIINVSTDEVYGALDEHDPCWYEDAPLNPNSPYSASKAAADMLCRSYINTYGINAITTRCTNNFGTRQHDEKLIPTIVRSIVYDIPVPVYGEGTNRREWIPVQSHVNAIIAISEAERRGIFNVVEGLELENIALVYKIIKICKQKGYENGVVDFVEDRLGHDFRYAIHTSAPEYAQKLTIGEFDKYLDETVDYYLAKYEREKTQF